MCDLLPNCTTVAHFDNNNGSFDNNSSNVNTTETDYYIPGQLEFRYVTNILLTILSCLGAVLNISIIRFSRKLREHTGDLTHSFVCSMAVADLLLCCFAQPFEFILDVLTSAEILSLPDWICRVQHMIYWLGYSASGISLTLLNLDKLIFFKWPLHYGSIDADKTARYSISLSWILCSLGTIMMILPDTMELSKSGDCITDKISKGLYIFYTVAFCLLPILSSAFVSAYLARLVTRMQKKNRTTEHFTNLERSTNLETSETNIHHQHHRASSTNGNDAINDGAGESNGRLGLIDRSSQQIRLSTSSGTSGGTGGIGRLEKTKRKFSSIKLRKNSSHAKQHGNHSDSSVQQRLRAMAYIFITTAWTVVSLSPYRVFNIVRLYYFEVWYKNPSTYLIVSWLGHVLILLLALNPFVDACLTLFTYAPYKNLAKSSFASFKNRVHSWSCCKKLLGGGSRRERIDWV